MNLKLSLIRNQAGYPTQKDFIKAVRARGYDLSLSQLANLERGHLRRYPTSYTMMLLMDMLHLTERDVLLIFTSIINKNNGSESIRARKG